MYTEHNAKWDKDNGNEYLVATYPLNEDSWVIELGGFMGNWARRIYNKYRSNILVVEPIEEFCQPMYRDFNNLEKIHVEQLGISNEKKDVFLSHNGDASSQYLEQTIEQVQIHCEPIEFFLEKYKINKIDLIQLNIEGEEFPLLEYWLQTDILSKIKFLQIQFHRMGSDYEERRKKIQEGLISKGFECRWDYPYVFESWENKNFK